MLSAENLLKDSFFVVIVQIYFFINIIHTKTPNLIGAQVVHFRLTTYNTFVCQFIGSFRLTFQPHSRRPSVATADSPCGDTAGETDNQVSVATNQWLLGHESLSTNQPTVCLTPFGLSVQINNKMSVLLSFLL